MKMKFEIPDDATRLIIKIDPIPGLVFEDEYRFAKRKGKWIPMKRKQTNVSADRNHIPLSEITIDTIFNVFAYCNVGGKMRLVRKVPATIDPDALTLEFMANEEFLKAFINTAEDVFIESEVIDKDAPEPAEGEPYTMKKKVVVVSQTLATRFLAAKHRMTYDRMVFEADAAKVKPTELQYLDRLHHQTRSRRLVVDGRHDKEVAREQRRRGI
jgi:hypothetical protein